MCLSDSRLFTLAGDTTRRTWVAKPICACRQFCSQANLENGKTKTTKNRIFLFLQEQSVTGTLSLDPFPRLLCGVRMKRQTVRDVFVCWWRRCDVDSFIRDDVHFKPLNETWMIIELEGGNTYDLHVNVSQKKWVKLCGKVYFIIISPGGHRRLS